MLLRYVGVMIVLCVVVCDSSFATYIVFLFDVQCCPCVPIVSRCVLLVCSLLCVICWLAFFMFHCFVVDVLCVVTSVCVRGVLIGVVRCWWLCVVCRNVFACVLCVG